MPGLSTVHQLVEGPTHCSRVVLCFFTPQCLLRRQQCTWNCKTEKITKMWNSRGRLKKALSVKERPDRCRLQKGSMQMDTFHFGDEGSDRFEDLCTTWQTQRRNLGNYPRSRWLSCSHSLEVTLVIWEF